MTQRYFIDERIGCIAVRDSQHPKYDKDYNGLHEDTPDVVYYAIGYKDDTGWNVYKTDRAKAKELCDKLNRE